MILNFGHTFGHAIEKYFEYKTYTHGEAVAMGMVFISDLSHKLGFCQKDVAERIKNYCRNLICRLIFQSLKPRMFFDAVIKDKVRTNSVNLVLIENIGIVRIEAFSKERIGGLINEMLGN